MQGSMEEVVDLQLAANNVFSPQTVALYFFLVDAVS